MGKSAASASSNAAPGAPGAAHIAAGPATLAGRLAAVQVRIAAAARAAGIAVRMETYPRMWHVFQLFLALPQALASLDDIAAFLTLYLGSGRPQSGLPPSPHPKSGRDPLAQSVPNP